MYNWNNTFNTQRNYFQWGILHLVNILIMREDKIQTQNGFIKITSNATFLRKLVKGVVQKS
jgi:hypothetical protein